MHCPFNSCQLTPLVHASAYMHADPCSQGVSWPLSSGAKHTSCNKNFAGRWSLENLYGSEHWDLLGTCGTPPTSVFRWGQIFRDLSVPSDLSIPSRSSRLRLGCRSDSGTSVHLQGHIESCNQSSIGKRAFTLWWSWLLTYWVSLEVPITVTDVLLGHLEVIGYQLGSETFQSPARK